MEAVMLCGVGVLAALTGLGIIELREGRRKWQTVELRFGRDVTPEAVAGFLDRLAGLHRGAAVVLEVRAARDELRHFLSSDQATIETLRGSLRALLPSLRLVPAAPGEAAATYQFGRVVRLRGQLRTIRQDVPAETSAGLLAAMQPVGEREQLLLRWLIGPGRMRPVPHAHGQTIEAEDRRRLRIKNDGSVLRVRGVIAVRTTNSGRAGHLLGRVVSVLRGRSTAYGQLRTMPRSGGWLAHIVTSRRLFLADRFSAAELTGLLGWPIEAPVLPGLSLGTSPLLMPSQRLPRAGRLLGAATWPGNNRPIAQSVVGGLSHSLIAGPTGVGKSTLVTSLAAADIAAGRGVVVIDGKGDTVAGVLARIPESRRDDVVVLDCAADGPQPGIRLFGGGDAELAADVVLGVLSDLFRDSWGPLSERYLRAALVAVAHDPVGTLADVPFVFSDAAYRRRLVGRLRDPLTKATFAAFEAMSPGERQHQLAAPLGKLGQLIGRPIVRTVLGQAQPQLDFREVLRRRRIVLISLSPGRVGAPAARLIGALSVFALFQAVQRRASLPESARTPSFVYIDEPRALGDLNMPLDTLLEQARGLGVGVALAPQSMSQLPKSVREAALTNVATRVVFRQHADDARLLARDLPGVTPEDLGDLAAFEAVARIALGPGDVVAPVTIKTAPLGKAASDPIELRALAAARWGVGLDAVDAALEARHHQIVRDVPVGRRRRPS